MDLPEPPARSDRETRAPINGLKLMVIILAVFAFLAAYGLWEANRRPLTEKATVIPAPEVSPSLVPPQH